MSDGIRAFSDARYDYYELQKDLEGIVPAGAIFVHDTDDHQNGSLSNGCLKLCWTPDGNVYFGSRTGLAAGSVILHTAFIDTNLFRKIRSQEDLEKEIYEELNHAQSLIHDMQSVLNEINDIIKSGL